MAVPPQIRPSRYPCVYISFLVILFIALSNISPSQKDLFRQLTNLKEDVGVLSRSDPQERPTMYTFYEHAGGGNPDKKQLDLIDAWKTAWYESGWQPVILTLDDAKRHPDYDMFRQSFDEATSKMNNYNQMCFYRWLAVAASGGGWMSDYDMFPLHSNPSSDLPNHGKFTGHQSFVPGLISGSASEWNRMVSLLLESYKEHSDEFWSDMLAMKHVYDKYGTEGFISSSENVITVDKLYLNDIQEKHIITDPFDLHDKCQQTQNVKAIHFAHASCDVVGFCHEKREMFVGKWIQVWNAKCRDTRPIMHTFFEPAYGSTITQQQSDMLNIWTTTWHNAGWQPIVLTLDDAKRHSDYDKFHYILTHAKKDMGNYDHLCFYRWLAMASSGGGWMSDYDTLPLHANPIVDLPNDGKFTGYQGFVPALLSGSTSEWNRMATLLLESYEKHSDKFWSDMLALYDVGEDKYIVSNLTASFDKFYEEETVEEGGEVSDPFVLEDKCQMTENVMAVHFSHTSCKKVHFCKERAGPGARDRMSVANMWVQSWKAQCLNKYTS